jgi:hypothetical protein
MQFAAACARLRGGVQLRDLDDAFVASAPVQALMRKSTPRSTPRIAGPSAFGATYLAPILAQYMIEYSRLGSRPICKIALLTGSTRASTWLFAQASLRTPSWSLGLSRPAR